MTAVPFKLNWQDLDLEQTGSSQGHCDCCGTQTQRIWGFVNSRETTVAAYYVGWTVGKPDHGAVYDLIIGKWGDNTSEVDRTHVALDFTLIEEKPNFIVVNATNRSSDYSSVAHSGFLREEVIGTPIAEQVFAIVDAIYMSQGMNEIRSWTN